MKIAADLHLHTHFSDGLLSPEELIERAIAIGLKAIAISDHDSVAAIKQARAFAKDKLQIIPAIELSSEIDGKDLHLLGYFIDIDDPQLLKEINKFKQARHDRAYKMIDNLKKSGMPIDFKVIEDLSGGGAIGRPHIARALVTHGHATSTQDAFNRYLKEGSPFYEPKYKIDPFHAIQLVRKNGGIPVWAHPSRMNVDHKLPQFVEAGLQGIEVYHPSHDWRDINRYLNLVKVHDLLITGGSDYHGHDYGAQIGEIGIDESLLKRLNESTNTKS